VLSFDYSVQEIDPDCDKYFFKKFLNKQSYDMIIKVNEARQRKIRQIELSKQDEV